MIVPISSEGADNVVALGPDAIQTGGNDEANQLMAIAQLKSTGRLQPQSADTAPQSHKSTSDQLKGKVA